MAIYTPDQFSQAESTAYSHAADNISSARLLGRRLARPQTYVRAIQEVRDRRRWPIIDHTIQRAITQKNGKGAPFSIVQIGANDGNRNDPIQRYVRQPGVQSLLVEPVPLYFDQLRENYRGVAGVKLAQVAIDKLSGVAEMLAVSPDSRLRGSSSMHPEVIKSAAWVTGSKDISGIVTPIKVPTQTLPELLHDHEVSSVDFLVVDTEGHDKTILDQVTPDFVAATGLRHVIWEHMHLPSAEQRELTAKFQNMGFVTTDLRRDTFATLPDFISPDNQVA